MTMYPIEAVLLNIVCFDAAQSQICESLETLDVIIGKTARGSPRSPRAGTLSKVITWWCAHAKLTRAFGTFNEFCDARRTIRVV